MSEEEQRITKVEKEKDPRRVASGKRLGAISKAAKINKENERQRSQERMECIDEEPVRDTCDDGGYSAITIITGVGVLTGLICLYFTYKQDKRAQTATKSQVCTQPTDTDTTQGTPRSRLQTLGE